MNISIIGSGTVGYAVGKGFLRLGHDVLFCDTSKRRVEELRERGVTASLENKAREITFVAVPAPTKDDKKLDLSYTKEVLEDIGQEIRGRNDYPIIVIKSTILPFHIKEDLLPVLEEASGRKWKEGFGFCHNPEFLRERHALEDFMKPDRIVLGGDERSLDKLEGLYSPLDAPIYRVTIEEAAMIKYVANCFLSTKISYFNEVYLIAKEYGIDPDVVSEAVRSDERITNYGTVGGKEFDGRCLPKDLKAFIHFGEKKTNPSLLKAVKKVNEEIATSEHRRKIGKED